MTKDLSLYTFLIEFKDFSTDRLKGSTSENLFIERVIEYAEKVMTKNKFTGYRVHVCSDSQFTCYSNHSILNSLPNINQAKKIISTELRGQLEEYSTLTGPKKQIFRLLTEGIKQSDICKILKLKMDCYKYHKKQLYDKMNFKTKTDLMLWYYDNKEYINKF